MTGSALVLQGNAYQLAKAARRPKPPEVPPGQMNFDALLEELG